MALICPQNIKRLLVRILLVSKHAFNDYVRKIVLKFATGYKIDELFLDYKK